MHDTAHAFTHDSVKRKASEKEEGNGGQELDDAVDDLRSAEASTGEVEEDTRLADAISICSVIFDYFSLCGQAAATTRPQVTSSTAKARHIKHVHSAG